MTHPTDSAPGDADREADREAAERRAERLLALERLRRANARPASSPASVAVRAGRRVRRSARSVGRRLRSAISRPASAGAENELWPTAAQFRAVLLERISTGSAAAGGPLRIAIMGDQTSPDRQAAELGWTSAFRAAIDAAGIVGLRGDDGPAAGEPLAGVDVALVIDPLVAIGALPGQVIKIGWLAGRPGAWLSRPEFNTLDIILVADDAARAATEAGSAKAAWVVADPRTAIGAGDLKAALERWLAARRVAIQISPPTWDAAGSWGDTPFGRDVQRAFERRGWPATLHVFAERDSPAVIRADLAVHILGLRAPEVRPGQTTVLWLISHPDRLRPETCRAYDVVGVGSEVFLRHLRRLLGAAGPMLIPLHQATDTDRFFPEAGGPAHEILFVGSSRPGSRIFLDALAGTSHDFAVYGRNWTPDLLDPRHVRGEWIANDELHRLYASAAIVLSDSWPDMRDEGFIPNRVYDALASGAFVLSEAIPGLAQEFDGSVATYRDGPELRDQVERFLGDPGERRRRAQAGRQAVLSRHTFGHRVDAIIAAVEPALKARQVRAAGQ